MTTSAPKPKRKPAGAAVPGAVHRPINYPRTLVVLISEDMHERLHDASKATGRSRSELAREWLDMGSELNT